MPNQLQGKAEQTRRTFIATAAIAATLVIGLAQSSASARPEGTKLPPDLAQAWKDYNQATMRKDVAKLSSLVTDDYMLVNSDSSVQDKTSYLADFRVPGFTLDPYEIEQPLQKMWGNTALTGGLFNLGWTQDGRHQSRRLRIAHVWSKKDGRWRIAYTQLTRVPE
ncbi:MAG TPA: nuclear transport factor 2 family protein [Sphingomicrobium sp.]|nr:nuclear transport factor 2 family protein [Sphingomicrobium sp.]